MMERTVATAIGLVACGVLAVGERSTSLRTKVRRRP